MKPFHYEMEKGLLRKGARGWMEGWKSPRPSSGATFQKHFAHFFQISEMILYVASVESRSDQVLNHRPRDSRQFLKPSASVAMICRQPKVVSTSKVVSPGKHRASIVRKPQSPATPLPSQPFESFRKFQRKILMRKPFSGAAEVLGGKI